MVSSRGDGREALVRRARAIAPLIEAQADAVEAEARITRPIHEALVDAKLIWLPLPAAYGGADADMASCIEVVEEISRADGSTGWSFFVNLATFSGLFPFLNDETLALLYADGPPVCAGQLVPVGAAEAAEGGLRCSGRHGFASGSAFAGWICAMQVRHEAGSPMVKVDGTPRTSIALLRRDEVEFQDNWSVMGLAGTASHDFRVPEQVVPWSRVVDGDILLPGAVPLRGSATLRMGPLATAYAMHSACVLGIAKRAIQEVAVLARTKTRAGYDGPIAQDPVFLNGFAHVDAEYHAARGRLLEVFARAEAKVAAGAALAPADFEVMRQTSTWVHGKAGETVATCFRWAGTTPVRHPSALGRCMRDVLVANSHMLFDPKSLTGAGATLVESWASGR